MVKLDIYCGLLGCGKTTLIKQLLKTVYLNKRIAIIENEIGKVNIDAEEFEETKVNVTELTSGCVCCSIKGNLQVAIKKIIEEQQVEYIILEPTGAADIDGLLDVCDKTEFIELHHVVMLVNAKKIKSLLKIVGEFYIHQIQHASVIYLNFTDNLEQSAIEEAKEVLLEINSEVKFVDTPLEKITAHTFEQVCINNDRKCNSKSVNLIVAEATVKHQPVKISAKKQQKIYTWSTQFHNLCSEQKVCEIEELLKETDACEIWRVKGTIPMEDGSIRKINMTFGDWFEETRENLKDTQMGALIVIGKKLNIKWLEEKILYGLLDR